MILIQSVLRLLRRRPEQPGGPGPEQPDPEDRPAAPETDTDREGTDPQGADQDKG
jgi:hypothetical protein